jgi:HD-GYP domain-containing protein (c-di-GMP phosphodiesterase class II)
MGQMEIFEAVAAIPSYLPFRPAQEKQENLVGILLLGEKKFGGKIHQDELDFFVALSSDVAMALHNAQLFNELQQQLDRERRLFMHTTVALAAAIDAKDHYTHGHTERVTNYCMAIAEEINCAGKITLDDKFKQNLHVAALLHDIGKIGVPEHILNKASHLNEKEYGVMKEHPRVGANIIKPIKELEECIAGVEFHHERFDGAGYPSGLKGEAIPLIARIIGVADAFDAMLTDRPYRNALAVSQAAANLVRGKGTQFDPMIVDSFVSYLIRSGKLQENQQEGFKVLSPETCPVFKPTLLTTPPTMPSSEEIIRSISTRRKRGRSAKRWL